MSTTIDQRVVEMRFDNQNFEKNVSTTMSTLDKLKQKLNLTGASKGLEEVNSAAKKVDMSGLGKGVEAVSAKFSAMQVIGTTALVNLTNQAVNAGKRMVSALTIDPVKTGLSEYETKINAIQVIQANTRGKNTMDDITAALEELNTYADKTIYNFAQMTSNIGKFTAQGFDVQKATNAVKGLANLAAASGASAEDMARATYQMSQALGSTIKLMDWNSLRNANMATVELKNTLIDLAKVNGIAIDDMIKKHGAFEQTLSEGWLTGDMFSEAMNIYSGVYTDAELAAKGFTESQIKNFKDLAKMAESAATEVKTFTQLWDVLKETAQSGWTQTWELIIGDFESAKDTLTKLQVVFSDIINKVSDVRNDILRGALGSKWDRLVSQIQKAGYTTDQFTDKLSGVLEESGVSVDELTEKYGSLGKAIAAGAVPVKAITKALKRLLGMEEKAGDATEKVTMSVEELEKVAKRVIKGEFGNGVDRVKALTEAGYDYATIQNKVNELLGVSVRHTSDLTEEQLANADSLVKMTDEQLKAKGYTEEQIEALRELEKAAKGADSTITDLINDLEKPSGRTLLLESFVAIWERIKELSGYIGEAWRNIFGEKDTDYYADGLYGLIESFHELTTTMEISEDTANNFRTIMEGLFAGFQLTGSIASKSVIAGIKILDAVLGLFGTDILGVAAKLSEYIITFNDWVKAHTMFGYGTQFTKIAEVLVAIYDGVSKCVKAFIDLEKVQGIITKVKDAISSLFSDLSGPVDFFSLDGIITTITEFFNKLESWIKGIDAVDDLGLYLLEGIKSAINGAFDHLIAWVNGLGIFDSLGLNIIQGILEGMLNAAKGIFNIAIDIATSIYESFCNFFQVNSPSRLMMSLGGFIVSGLILGITQGFGDVSGILQDLLAKCTSGFDWSKISAMFWNISALLPSAPIFNTIAALANTFSVFGDQSATDIISGLVQGLAGGAQKVISAIVELASNLISSFKDKIDSHSPSKVFMAIGGFIIAGLILGLKEGLISVPESMQGIVDKCIQVISNIPWSELFAVGISVAGLMLVKKFGDILEQFAKPFGKLGDLFGALTSVVKSFGDVTKALTFNIKAKAIKQLAIALAILVGSVVAITLLVDDPWDLLAATTTIIVLAGVLVGLAYAMNQLGDASLKFEKGKGFSFNGLKQSLISIGLAILMVGGITAILGNMKPDELEQGLNGMLKVMVSMLAFVGVLQLLGKIKGTDHIDKVGGMAFKIALAMGLMALVVKMVGKLKPSELTKGIIFMAAYSLFVKGLIKAATIGNAGYFGKGSAATTNTSIGKIGGMLLGVTVALGLMVGVCKLASKLDASEMLKGAAFAGAFIVFVKGLVWAASLNATSYFGNGTMSSSSASLGKVGGMILGVTIAMMLMVGLCKVIDSLSFGEMAKGAIFVTAFLVFVRGLVKVTTIAKGTEMAKITGTLLGLSLAIVVLAGVCAMLSILEWNQLAKGLIGIGVLSAFITGIVWAARGVQDIKGTLTMLVIGIGMLAAIMAALMLVKDPKKLIAPVAALGTLLVTFGYAIKSMSAIDPQKGLLKNLIMMIGVTVLLGGMVAALSKIQNPDGALKASLALSALLLALSVSMTILGKAGNISKSVSNNLGIMLLISAGLAVILGVFTALPNPERAIPGAVALGVLLNAFAASIAILKTGGRISKSVASNLGVMLLIAGGLGLILGVFTALPNPERAIPAAVAMGVLINAFSASIAILKTGGSISKSVADNLGIMLLVASGLGLILGVFTALPNPERAIPASIAMGILLNTFASSIAILKTGGSISKSVADNLGVMLLISAGLAVILGVFTALPNPERAIPAAVALGVLLNAFSASMFILGRVGSISPTAAKNMLPMLGVALGLSGIVYVLSLVKNTEAAMTNAVTLSGLMLILTGLMAAVSAVGKYLSGGIVKGIAGLSGMVVPLALFAAALHFMPDLGNAREKITALSSLMTAMTILLPIVSVIGKFLKGGMVAGIGGLTAMAIPLFAFAFTVSKMPVVNEGTITSIKALTQVMVVMTVLLAAVSAVGMFLAAGVVPGIVALCGFMAVMGVFVALVGQLLDKFPQIQTWVDKGIPLLVQLAGGIGEMIGAFIQVLGAAVGATLVQFGEDIAAFMAALSTAAENASGIEEGSFDGVYDLIKALGGIAAVAAGTRIADLFLFFTGGGNSMDKFKTDAIAFFDAMKEIAPKMAECSIPENFSVDAVISLLEAMKKIGGYAVGSQIAEWFYFGDKTTLDKFKSDAINFFTAMKELPEHMTGFNFPSDFNIEGLETLLSVLKKVAWSMAGVSIADKFAQIAGDEGTMEKFKTDAITFFDAIKELPDHMVGFKFPKDFSVDGLTKMLDALKAVAWAMTGVSIADKFAQIAGDEGTMEKFKTDAVAFFQAIDAISTAMVDVTYPADFSTEGLSTVLDAIKMVSKSMSGDWWRETFVNWGEDSITQLETKGTGLFAAIKAISTEATGVTTESFDVATTAIDKLKQIFDSLIGIDYSGVEAFTGIGTGGFGADGPMHDIGVAIKDFGTQVAGIDVAVISTAVTAAGKIRTLIANLVNLDTSGIENFKAKAIGTAIKDYSSQVAGIDPAVVSSSISSANRLRNFIASLVDLDSSGIGNFKLGTIGDTIKSYAGAVAGIEVGVVSSSISIANRLKNFIASLVGIDTSGVAAYKSAIDSLSTVSLDKFVEAFNVKLPNLSNVGANVINTLVQGIQSKQANLSNTGRSLIDTLSKGIESRKAIIVSSINKMLGDMINLIRSRANVFGTAGTTLMAQFVGGITKHSKAPANAMTAAIRGTLTSISGYYDNFYSIGASLVDGFAAGISANRYKAAAKAAAMAAAAEQAAKEELDINSPSKIFRAIGYSIPEGFAMGIDKLSGMAVDSASSMANSTFEAVSTVMSAISAAMDDEMELQPMIRPVVDLTNVRSSSGSIGSMLGFGSSIGVRSNLGAISSMMNANQNGGNDDIVSAINKLRKDMSGMGGTTYQINGINYSNDSNVEAAFETIMRAARMERRM